MSENPRRSPVEPPENGAEEESTGRPWRRREATLLVAAVLAALFFLIFETRLPPFSTSGTDIPSLPSGRKLMRCGSPQVSPLSCERINVISCSLVSG